MRFPLSKPPKGHRELLFLQVTVAFNGHSTRVAPMGFEPIIPA